MIRSLVKLGVWLDRRFPEKVFVSLEEYEILLGKIRHLEATSAHIEAVRKVILEMQKIKDEYASLKTSLGINGTTGSLPVASAYLNDLPLGDYNDNER